MKLYSAIVFFPIALAVFGIAYYYFTTRHRECMALLERGLPAGYFGGRLSWLPFILLLGIVSVGIALGIITGACLRALDIPGIGEYAFPAAIFFFQGISLLIAWYVLKQAKAS